MSEPDTDEPKGPERLRPYQFKPGQSGNPNGRPKGRSITSILRELLDQAVRHEPGERPLALRYVVPRRIEPLARDRVVRFAQHREQPPSCLPVRARVGLRALARPQCGRMAVPSP